MSILGTLPQGNIVFCDLRCHLSVLSFSLLQTISTVQIYLPVSQEHLGYVKCEALQDSTAGVHTLKFVKSCLVPAAKSVGDLEPLFLVAALLEGS